MSVSEKDGAQAAAKVLALLEAIVMDDGHSPAARIATELGLAPSTARRLLAVLVQRSLVVRVAHGHYTGGDRLRELGSVASPHARLIGLARPVLNRLARMFGCTAHLGVYENDMVTYLVKAGIQTVFTREHNQLEAYCTGIGKALLAQLSLSALDAYLQQPLVRLTDTTITDPDLLRDNLRRIRAEGYAIDDGEMAESLFCIAAPLNLVSDRHFAISVSGHPERFMGEREATVARAVKTRADEISAAYRKGLSRP